jgi:hypothetical protein
MMMVVVLARACERLPLNRYSRQLLADAPAQKFGRARDDFLHPAT